MSADGMSTIPAPRVPSIEYESPDGEVDNPTTLADIDQQEKAREQVRAKDWSDVVAALDRCASSNDETAKAIAGLSKQVNARFDRLEKKRAEADSAQAKMLSARFDDVDAELASLNRKMGRANGLIAALNQIQTGLRSFGKSMHDRLDRHDEKLRALAARRIRFRSRDARRRQWLRVVSNQG